MKSGTTKEFFRVEEVLTSLIIYILEEYLTSGIHMAILFLLALTTVGWQWLHLMREN